MDTRSPAGQSGRDESDPSTASFELKRSSHPDMRMVERAPGQEQASMSAGGDKKRGKLQYQRISVACTDILLAHMQDGPTQPWRCHQFNIWRLQTRRIGPRGNNGSRVSRVRQPRYDELDGPRSKPWPFKSETLECIVDTIHPGPGDSSELFTIQPQHAPSRYLDSYCAGRLVDEGWYAMERISSAESVVHGHVANDSKRVRP
ncbi:hypothetical protein SLS53_002986 [Cytospora paraplurivora]|uniref:Uncharacterized protein n=1 Tax=Cytospora paraplurivora TaxID=2898453 RepID=A0AAN9YHV5_9PEZI